MLKMQRLLKLFFLFFFLISLGCQAPSSYKKSTKIPGKISIDHKQVFILFTEGMHNQDLTKREQISKCNQLKKGYQTNPNWQTAWLMVYTLNEDYSCMNQKETLNLFKKIQIMPGVSPQLLWLNKSQILWHSKLKQSGKLQSKIKQSGKLQSKLNKVQKKNNSLQNQLEITKNKLEQVNSKIQALKTIETNINKKLDKENAN